MSSRWSEAGKKLDALIAELFPQGIDPANSTHALGMKLLSVRDGIDELEEEIDSFLEDKSEWVTFATEDGSQSYCPKHKGWALSNTEGLTYQQGAPPDAGCEACFAEKKATGCIIKDEP